MLPPSSKLVGNLAPYFVPDPSGDLVAYVGKPFEHTFGRAFDFEGDQVTVRAELGSASKFVKFDPKTNSLSIAAGATSLKDPRFNLMKIVLTESKLSGALSTTYSVRLVLEELLEVGQESEKRVVGPGEASVAGFVGSEAEVKAKLMEVEEKFEKRVYDLRETTLDKIYVNELNQTYFDKVDVFNSTNLGPSKNAT